MTEVSQLIPSKSLFFIAIALIVVTVIVSTDFDDIVLGTEITQIFEDKDVTTTTTENTAANTINGLFEGLGLPPLYIIDGSHTTQETTTLSTTVLYRDLEKSSTSGLKNCGGGSRCAEIRAMTDCSTMIQTWTVNTGWSARGVLAERILGICNP